MARKIPLDPLSQAVAQSAWASIARNKLSPEITLDAHVRQAQIALGQELANRTAIYLDMNFWIMLRAAASQSDSGKSTELLALLRRGVASGRLFCPISESVFLELERRTFNHTHILRV